MSSGSRSVSLAFPTQAVTRTKRRPPRVRADWVVRERLLDRLDQGLACSLILVSAPAGFGKTSLLAQWVGRSALPVAWVSLDEGDDKLLLFLAYLVAAIQDIFPLACRDVARLVSAPQQAPPGVLAATLLDDIADISGEFILVLDDYHLLTDEAIHAVMTELVSHLPDNLRLVLATRSDPPLPIPKLRARRDAVELRASDLQFTVDEAQAILAPTFGVVQSREIAEAAQHRTEGWIAGLQLAVLSLRAGQHANDLVAALGRSGGHYVMEYLLSEVLACQSPSVQSFLLRTSILTRLSGDLCDSIIGASGLECRSHDALAQLERENTFVFRLDEEGDWYRYHQLFQDLLQHELFARTDQAEIAALHRRASAWWAKHGMIDEALRHALAAQDTAEAARLVEEQIHPALNRESVPELERWLDVLPEEVIQRRPTLLTARAEVYGISGRYELIPALLQRADEILDSPRGPLSVRDGASLHTARGIIECLRTVLLYRQNRSEEGIIVARRALNLLPPTATYARSQALFRLAQHLQRAGEDVQALSLLQAAVEADAERGVLASRALLGRCYIHLQDGHLERAYAEAQQLLQLAQDCALPFGLSWGHYMLGYVAYERNDLEAACDHFVAVLDRRYQTSGSSLHDSFVGLSLAYFALGQPSAAREVGRDLAGYAEQTLIPEARLAADGLRARLALASGDVDAARALFAALDTKPGSLMSLDIAPLVQIRILLAEKTTESLRQAAEQLSALQRFAEATHNRWLLYSVQALQAVVDARLGKRPIALALLQRALISARPEGYVRVFVDSDPDIGDLLRELRSRGLAPEYLDRLLIACESGRGALPHASDDSALPGGSGAERARLASPLTHRELEILGLLDLHYSDKEIAEALIISENTVHAHARNLYRKLDVGGRHEAVARARALGLLAS